MGPCKKSTSTIDERTVMVIVYGNFFHAGSLLVLALVLSVFKDLYFGCDFFPKRDELW